MKSSAASVEWGESPGALEQPAKHTGNVFQRLFERSADAIWLPDPHAGVLMDCNRARLNSSARELEVLNSPSRKG